MAAPLVYLLVLNYCSAEDTLGCVQHIKQINYPNLRLLVIDNASPDGDGEILRRKIPPLEFLQLSQNIGYAGGNNEGMRIALKNGAEYVFIVNPDIRLSPESVKSYVDLLCSDSTIGALTPIEVMKDAHTIDEQFRIGIFESHKIPVPNLACHSEQQWAVRTLYGAALMLPASTIRKVGGFDPLYFAYGEEEDLCRRVLYHGLRLVVTAKAPAIHLRTKDTDGVSDFVLFLRLKSSYLYELKNPIRNLKLSLRLIANYFKLDILGRRSLEYPFNRYPVRKRHVIKTGAWILWHLQQIRMHRKMDKVGECYLWDNQK